MRFLDRFRRRRQPPSGEIARERLRLVLAHDRANISPGLLDTLKDEIIAVISRHVPIDPEGVRVTFTEGPRESRLVADIPIQTGRRRRG
ncbi:MAG TPA: cell division topological specificity factor MinE [Anaerolineales bacterium]|nr:cell division topological specificity factor MinE [Anaerolineae bacterium]HIQ02370.1 cell division topological specificity factor MinE [Anaerolineales bacterium]